MARAARDWNDILMRIEIFVVMEKEDLWMKWVEMLKLLRRTT
jgi:hypothetical protein